GRSARSGRCSSPASEASGCRAEVALAGPPELLPPRHGSDDARQLLHALGERRRPRLQDDRALDLVELVVDDRAHPGPARPGANLFRLRLPPAPARHDALRVAAGYLLGLEDAALRALAGAALRADVHAAHQLHQLAAPPDAADQRLVPLLEEH